MWWYFIYIPSSKVQNVEQLKSLDRHIFGKIPRSHVHSTLLPNSMTKQCLKWVCTFLLWKSEPPSILRGTAFLKKLLRAWSGMLDYWLHIYLLIKTCLIVLLKVLRLVLGVSFSKTVNEVEDSACLGEAQDATVLAPHCDVLCPLLARESVDHYLHLPFD